MLQPEGHPLLVCEPPLNPAATRERLCDLAFATFGFQSFYLANSHQLALYAAGKTTGTVVEVSAGSSSVAATYEGYLLHHTVKVGVGGNALAACLFPAVQAQISRAYRDLEGRFHAFAANAPHPFFAANAAPQQAHAPLKGAASRSAVAALPTERFASEAQLMQWSAKRY